MKRAVLAASACIAPLAAHAQLSAFEGIWCSDETVYVDAYGIGFNEHTMCDFEGGGPLISSSTYAATVQCRNVHVLGRNEDGTYATNETPLPGPIDIQMTLIDTNHLTLSLTGPNRTPANPLPVYERCD